MAAMVRSSTEKEKRERERERQANKSAKSKGRYIREGPAPFKRIIFVARAQINYC